MAQIPLPFYAAPSELPQSLPTKQEIEDSTDELMDSGSRRLVRIGPFIIKYGSGVSVIEGENMLFVSRQTKVPVPHVYAIYTDTESKSNYIVMEYIEGQTLEFEWGLLSEKQKEDISGQLRGYMDQLRSIPSPGYYGSIGGRGLLDCIFWTGDDAGTELNGPFDTEDEFNEAMRNKYIYNELSLQKAEFYGRAFPVVFKGHDPVYTHGDFQRKNIMIKRIPYAGPQDDLPDCQGQTSSMMLEKDTFTLTVVDWEDAGWYPTYWESAMALTACARWNDDWHKWVGKSLELFLPEFAWAQMLRNELWS